MTALQVGAPGERHFGTVKKCYPCCRLIKRKQGAEGLFPQPAGAELHSPLYRRAASNYRNRAVCACGGIKTGV